MFRVLLFVLFLFPAQFVSADNLGENLPELRICSQNLHNFGMPPVGQGKKNKKGLRRQKEYLISRIREARCDVVAVQEVWGERKSDAERALGVLRDELLPWREFVTVVGEGFSRPMRNGFLVARGAGKIVAVDGYSTLNAPKLSPLGPAERFLRPPLKLVLEVETKGKAISREVILFNIHLKSKVNGWKDPTRTQFETLRMELAEGVRREALQAKSETRRSPIVVILGDRNSTPDSASAAVLRGELELADFSGETPCRVGHDLSALCVVPKVHQNQFVGLLEEFFRPDKEHDENGTYLFRNRLELIDDILVQRSDLWMVEGSSKQLIVGTTGEFGKGSDHKLVWAEMNW